MARARGLEIQCQDEGEGWRAQDRTTSGLCTRDKAD